MATESQIALYENFKAINTIETASYDQFDVKRGLRNADGTGVIEQQLPRVNLLRRPAVANLTQVILTFAAAAP